MATRSQRRRRSKRKGGGASRSQPTVRVYRAHPLEEPDQYDPSPTIDDPFLTIDDPYPTFAEPKAKYKTAPPAPPKVKFPPNVPETREDLERAIELIGEPVRGFKLRRKGRQELHRLIGDYPSDAVIAEKWMLALKMKLTLVIERES